LVVLFQNSLPALGADRVTVPSFAAALLALGLEEKTSGFIIFELGYATGIE
jgi:hypothetical protein